MAYYVEISENSHAYDKFDDMLKMKSFQQMFRDDFSALTLDTTKWKIALLGSGMTVANSSGQLVIQTGTNINVETQVESVPYFTIPFKATFGFNITTNQANQEFYLEIVSVDPVTKIVDNKYLANWKLTNPTATTGTYGVQKPNNAIVTASNTISAWTSLNTLEIEATSDEVWFHSRIIDSSNGRINSYVKQQDIPDPNTLYKVRIRAKNLGTAPAINNFFNFKFIAVDDYTELTTEITASRGSISQGQGMAVVVTNSPNMTVTNTPNVVTVQSTASNGMTIHRKLSTADTNATSVKATAGKIGALTLCNASASIRYFKLYNKNIAPIVGTDIPVYTLPILANSNIDLFTNGLGMSFNAGIAYAITGALADADVTAILAGEVIVNMQYA